MKLFSLLCGLIFTFFSAYSQVVIKPETARFFLEQSDSLEVYKVKDTLQSILISNLRDQVMVKDQIIETYEADRQAYELQEVTFTEANSLLYIENEKLRKQVRHQKSLKFLAILGMIIAAITL